MGRNKKFGKITNEIFLNLANEIHNNKYEYILEEFKNTTSKIGIICKEHGLFFQKVGAHLYKGQGCKKCHNKKTSIRCKKTLQTFINEANIIHNNYYDYSKFEYLNAHDKSIIICPSHGEFLQSANVHLKGHKCKLCSLEISDNWGWSKTKWLEVAKIKIPKLYIVNFFNDEESFIKIGITTKPNVNYRLKQVPYNYNIIEVFELLPEMVWKLENLLKKEFRLKNKYIPNIWFKGMYECYNLEIKNTILMYINKIINE